MDPERLITGENDFERALLASARRDVASDPAFRRTVAALSGAGASLATGAAVASGTASATAIGASAVGVAVTAKWVTFGFLAGLATVGGLHLAFNPRPVSKAPARPRIELVAAPAATVATVPAQHPIRAVDAPATSEAAPTDSPSATSAPSALHPRTARVNPADMDSVSLTAEVTQLDSVRTALGRSDPRTALRALDEYDRRFPRGSLGSEAVVLRVQALRAAGDPSTASSVAQTYIDAHPNSAHAAMLRALIGEGGQP